MAEFRFPVIDDFNGKKFSLFFVRSRQCYKPDTGNRGATLV